MSSAANGRWVIDVDSVLSFKPRQGMDKISDNVLLEGLPLCAILALHGVVISRTIQI